MSLIQSSVFCIAYALIHPPITRIAHPGCFINSLNPSNFARLHQMASQLPPYLSLNFKQNNCGLYNYKIMSMLASTKKTINSSTVATKSVSIKQKESFFAFIFRKIREAFSRFFVFSRKCLWVSSTGLIVIILPFAFAYFLEMQKELMKIQGGINEGPQLY